MSVLHALCAPSLLLSSLSKQRRWLLALAIGLSAGTVAPALLWSQAPAAPVEAAITDDDDPSGDIALVNQQEPAEETPAEEPATEFPETVVPGRPGIFPAQPLAEDQAITPTRTPTLIGKTGTALTVITQQDIANSEMSSVAEVLRGKTGLDVVRSGGPGGQTSVFLRGANSQQTKVLLDGIPMNDPSNATRGFDFSSLDVENIERIEVLRGPQSLLYGSDAIGGVVNVITKRGNGPTTATVSGMGGSFGTYRTAANVSGGDDLKYFSLGGSYLATDGISAASKYNGNTENDGFKNGTLSGRFGITPSDQVNIDYVFRYTDADAKVDSFDFATGLPFDNFTERNLLNAFYNRVQMQSLFLDGGIEQIVGFSLTDYHRRDTDPGPYVSPVFDGQSRTVDWQLNCLLTETNTFTVGAQYYAEDASPTSFPAATPDLQASQYTKGLFLQDQWQIRDNWYASVGVRWDDNSRAGPAQTYRANSLYTIEEVNGDIHGSIGTGFRAPALAENLFQYGNPNLLPERSKGWDYGYTQRLFDNRFSIDATYFRNDFQDLIIFDYNTFALENIGLSRAMGVELTGNWQVVENTRLYSNYTLTNTLDLETDQPLLRRPRNKATVGIDQYLLERQLRIGAYMLYVGDRLDTQDRVLNEYAVVNLNSSYYFSPRAELFARMDNVFNERYEEVAGYGVPGVAGYAGMNLTW
ncbi:MAG TPA: TonB-dependent receptor [Pirellulaceae bacterium]|nr:TonB-dependent receptor [Pirellulaceae bacterium]